jgi:hypothetical protein
MAQSAVLLTDDLIFGSRVSGATRSLGSSLRIVKNVSEAITAVQCGAASCLIVDLAVVGSQLPDLIGGIRALSKRPRVVAYGSHVDTQGLRAATEAGCDLVLPRSRFVQLLDSDLSQWLSPDDLSRPGQAGQ